jgi:hypothetical protein
VEAGAAEPDRAWSWPPGRPCCYCGVETEWQFNIFLCPFVSYTLTNLLNMSKGEISNAYVELRGLKKRQTKKGASDQRRTNNRGGYN